MAKRSKKTRPLVEIGNEITEQLSKKATRLAKGLVLRKDIAQVVEINKILTDKQIAILKKEDDGIVAKMIAFYNDYAKAKSLGEKEEAFKNFSRFQGELRLQSLLIENDEEEDDEF